MCPSPHPPCHSMVIGCFCVSCNIHSCPFLQNYQSTQFVLRVNRVVHCQVNRRLEPGVVHEPVFSTIWCLLQLFMSQVAAWQPPGLPSKFSNLKPCSTPSMINCCACWVSKLPMAEVTSKHWYGTTPRMKMGRVSSSHPVWVWLHWTPSIMRRTAICPYRSRHSLWMQISLPSVKFFLRNHLGWTEGVTVCNWMTSYRVHLYPTIVESYSALEVGNELCTLAFSGPGCVISPKETWLSMTASCSPEWRSEHEQTCVRIYLIKNIEKLGLIQKWPTHLANDF